MEPILDLAETLRTRLSAELSFFLGTVTTVERRYAPYLTAEELEVPKWILMAKDEEVARQARGLAPGELSIDVAYQAALPPLSDREGIFIDTPTIDAMVEKVGKLKDLFRPGGSLRDERLADSEFRRYTNSPIYRPDLLVANGIFTSVVTLVYFHEFNDDD
jgi:hypothetical protein